MLKNSTVLFTLLWILTCIALGFLSKLPEQPNCTHQWAQADRASIARNYAEEDMNFFLPRVHNCTNKTGITGLEFPFVQYLTAICYQYLGFTEFWYRFIMLMIVSLGVLFAFKTALPFFNNNTTLAFCITLIWYCSPTLVFYTPNFIPDAASLGFCLISWYFFFRHIKTENRVSLILVFVFTTLASLIKITSLIGSICMLSISILSFINPNLFNITKKTSVKLIAVILPGMLITYGWYAYASWLNTTYGAEIFLLKLNPVHQINELLRDFKWVITQWGNQYYSFFSLTTGIWLFLFCLLHYKSVNRLLFSITLLYFIGGFAFMVLMLKQFLNHDYYIITLLPASFFLLLTFCDVVYRTRQHYIRQFKKQLTAGLVMITVGSFLYAKIMINARYANDAGSIFATSQFDGMEQYLRSIGISRTDKVVSMYDVSPNISLYFFNVKGITFNSKSIMDSAVVQSQSKDMDYLITTGDTVDVRYLRNKIKIGEKNGFVVYKFVPSLP